jgi:hypothetical protein
VLSKTTTTKIYIYECFEMSIIEVYREENQNKSKKNQTFLNNMLNGIKLYNL